MTEKSYTGVIIKWDLPRGFGFLHCDSNSKSYFAHIRNWQSADTVPVIGQQVLGVAVGLIGTYTTTTVLHHTSPTLQIEITADWIVRSILVAVGGALAGAAYPALRAARSDPIDALAYE